MFKGTSWHRVSDGYEPLSSSGLIGCFRCGALGRGGRLGGGHLGRPMGRAGQGKPPRPQVYVCDHNAPSPAHLRPKVWLASGAGEAVKPAQLPQRVVRTRHPPPNARSHPRAATGPTIRRQVPCRAWWAVQVPRRLPGATVGGSSAPTPLQRLVHSSSRQSAPSAQAQCAVCSAQAQRPVRRRRRRRRLSGRKRWCYTASSAGSRALFSPDRGLFVHV